MKLNFPSINTIDFYTSFFEKHQYPEIIKSISLFDERIGRAHNSEDGALTSKSHILESVPNYLKLIPQKGFQTRKTVIKPGFAIKLKKEHTSVEDYLRIELSKSYRKVIRSTIKRLETCFDIRHKTFFGNITQAECNTIMDKLKTMISWRFSERSGRNKALNNWEYFAQAAYRGINNKTASLFVTFDGDLPIQISLNFHFGNIMVGTLPSYDLDYSKFSLGNIGLYKQIEWCISNKIDLLDIGFGDFAYKRRWANLIYDFETLYLYNNNNPFHKLHFYLHEKKTKLVYYLIAKEFNNLYFDTLSKFKREKKVYQTWRLESIDTNGHIPFSQTPMNLNENGYSMLKRPLCDYAYKHKERFSDLKVYKAQDNSHIFLVKGKQSKAEVRLLN